jgi:hypothetical protein
MCPVLLPPGDNPIAVNKCVKYIKNIAYLRSKIQQGTGVREHLIICPVQLNVKMRNRNGIKDNI